MLLECQRVSRKYTYKVLLYPPLNTPQKDQLVCQDEYLFYQRVELIFRIQKKTTLL